MTWILADLFGVFFVCFFIIYIYFRLIFTFCRFSHRRASLVWCPGLPFLWAMVAEVARWDAYKFMGRRLLPDAFGYPVSRIVQLKGDVLRLPRLPFAFFVPSFWGLATLTKLNTEMHICCTNFFMCFPMKYWDFSVKPKPILPLVVTSEITIFHSLLVKADVLRILG